MSDYPTAPCPTCPVCRSLPMMVFGGGTQAFCGSDNCPVLTWDPQLPDGGLSEANFINLDEPGGAP